MKNSLNVECLKLSIKQIKEDIAARKSMPEFGESVDGNFERLRVINATMRSFSLDTIEMLVDALEEKDKRINELEKRLATPVRLPKTNGYWDEQEKAFEDAITLAKRAVRLAGFTVEEDE